MTCDVCKKACEIARPCSECAAWACPSCSRAREAEQRPDGRIAKTYDCADCHRANKVLGPR